MKRKLIIITMFFLCIMLLTGCSKDNTLQPKLTASYVTKETLLPVETQSQIPSPTLGPTPSQTPISKLLMKTLGELDAFYVYDEQYMIIRVNEELRGNIEMWEKKIVSADIYEELLNKYFLIDSATLEKIRNSQSNLLTYNEADRTYDIGAVGGQGGDIGGRDYFGYVKKDNTYEVYYQDYRLVFLFDLFPDDTAQYEYLESLGYPDTLEFKGITFESYMGDYCAITSGNNYGKKYTVENNDGTIRIISCSDYTEKDMPETLEDNENWNKGIYDITEDTGVTIPKNNCFSENTIIKVDKITEGEVYSKVNNAMQGISDKYTVYDFSAEKNNTKVNPKGTLSILFTIPKGYSSDVTFYRMTPEGSLIELYSFCESGIGYLTVQPNYFGTIIMCG